MARSGIGNAPTDVIRPTAPTDVIHPTAPVIRPTAPTDVIRPTAPTIRPIAPVNPPTAPTDVITPSEPSDVIPPIAPTGVIPTNEPADANGSSVMTPDELDEAMESRLAKELITEVYKVDGKRTITVLDSSTYRCEAGCKNTGRYNSNLKGSSVYDLPPKGQGIDAYGHVVQLTHFKMVQKNLKKSTATNAGLKEQYATNVSPYHRQANAWSKASLGAKHSGNRHVAGRPIK